MLSPPVLKSVDEIKFKLYGSVQYGYLIITPDHQFEAHFHMHRVCIQSKLSNIYNTHTPNY